MKKFTFKHYPPSVLAVIFCLIITLNFLFKKILASHSGRPLNTFSEIMTLLASGSIVTVILSVVNRFVMWKWFLNILGLCDIRGHYVGTLISSYHIDDDPQKSYIKKHLELHISQNLNGIDIRGKVYDTPYETTPSSAFKSTHTEMEQLEDGTYQVSYLYFNEGNLLSTANQLHQLVNHKGYAILNYNPADKSLNGIYFNHERQSHGRFTLKQH